MIRLAVIGAAGRVFGPQLLAELLSTLDPDDPEARLDVRLVDVDPDRLHAVARLWQRAVREERSAVRVSAGTDLAPALADADIVVHAAQVRRPEADRRSAEVLREHGYRREGSLQVAHGVWVDHRQLRLLDEIAAACAEHCPDAWLLQLANPVFAGVTHLGRTRPGLRVLGLCDGPTGIERILHAAGLDAAGADWSVAGVNHFVWLHRLTGRGGDELEALIGRLPELAVDGHADAFADVSPLKAELARRYGAVPVGDTAHALAGGWPWWVHSDPGTVGHREDHQRVWREMDDWYREIDATMDALPAAEGPVLQGLPRFESPAGVGAVVRALRGGGDTRLVANVVNHGGLVPGIPEDVAVELVLTVSRGAIEPHVTEPLPKPVLAWTLRDQVAPLELQLAAYGEGRRDLLVDLFMTDPWSRSRAQAQRAVDALLALPGNQDLAAHYG
jgi:alpha-galactosidase